MSQGCSLCLVWVCFKGTNSSSLRRILKQKVLLMTSSPVVRDSVENLRKRSMISARSSRKYYKNCVRMWQQEQQKNHLLPEGDLY